MTGPATDRGRRWFKPRRWWLASLVAFGVVGPEPTSGQQRSSPPSSLFDPRLEPLRRASASWEARQGPGRSVVDRVVLVPDAASFLDAVATWTEDRWFPILIEGDPERTLRFLRAFAPREVVRPARRSSPLPAGRDLWERAERAVESARGGGGGLGSPGVVLSSPNAPMLMGGVALAAGHGQPLVRFDPRPRDARPLTLDELADFRAALSAAVARAVPSCGNLGDDCDFITLAARYPYAYRDRDGEAAVDDALARSEPSGDRWAFVGRVVGDERSSVADAMAALFLPPDSATLFNGYDERARPWADYATLPGSLRLSGTMPVGHHSGDAVASSAGWHAAFDPINRSRLVWINSHGSPTVFHCRDEPASAADIPRSVPVAVSMIHSFSASAPDDPDTVAGRWLDHGAFVYFGSMNEPYLHAFRTPQLALNLVAEHLPMAAALRATLAEPYGTPWRLVYLGDPLYRLPTRAPLEAARRRLDPPAEATWTRVDVDDRAPRNLDPDRTLRWAVDAAIGLTTSPPTRPGPIDLAPVIGALADLDRDRLPPADRSTRDLLLFDLLVEADRTTEARMRAERIPPDQRSAKLRRRLDTLRAADLAWAISGDDFDAVLKAWGRIALTDASPELQEQATARASAASRRSPDRKGPWIDALRAKVGDRPLPPGRQFLLDELRRAEAAPPLDPRPAR